MTLQNQLYGNDFSLNTGLEWGFAGAKTETGTIVHEDGYLQDVIGAGAGAFEGERRAYRFLPQVIEQTRKIQAKGGMAYVSDFNEDLGLPEDVSETPSKTWMSARFYVSPFVRDIGKVVRGPMHHMSEPGIKYNVNILPLDYSNEMLGHRTVSEAGRVSAASVTPLGALLAGELHEKVKSGSTTLSAATDKLALYLSGKSKHSRRDFHKIALGALGLCAAFETACGGGSGGGGGGGGTSPPPVTTYTFSGAVLKRIAADGSKITQGSATLEGGGNRYSSAIDASGSFRITSVPAANYKLTIDDGSSGSVYVPHVEISISVSGDTTKNFSVIERGPNRFGVEFDSNFQAFYKKMAQANNNALVKWLDGSYPKNVVIINSTVPSQYNDADHYGKFKNYLGQVITNDTSVFYGSRLSTIPLIEGIADDYTIYIDFIPGISAASETGVPKLSGQQIIRANTTYDPDIVLAQMPNIPIIPTAMIHEYGHCAGFGDFSDTNFRSVMNNDTADGMFASDLTINDTLVGFLAYCLDVKPGNTAPDTNP